MKKQFFLIIPLLTFLFIGCDKSKTINNNIEKENNVVENNNTIINKEQTTQSKTSIDIYDIDFAPIFSSTSQTNEIDKNNSLNFDNLLSKEENKDKDKNEDNNLKHNNEETKNENNNIVDKDNKEEIQPNKEIAIVNKFIEPKNYDFSLYSNNEAFQSLQTKVSKLNKNAKLLIKENCISYNNSSNGPSIELFKTDDYYAIYLYCVLDENIEKSKESKEQIKTNNEVLKNILNTITTTPNEVLDLIYNDYEKESTLSEKIYTNVGDCKIKSEIMQRYVIYYIKK